VHIHTIRRAMPAAFAAAGLLLGAAACGGSDVDKGALVSKIKTDKSFPKALDDKQANCVADVVIKYVDGKDLTEYIKSGKEIPEPKKDKDKAATDRVRPLSAPGASSSVRTAARRDQ
jgi:hypothetical protein